MSIDYNQTKVFWESIFSKSKAFSINKPILNPQLNEAVSWIKEHSERVLDFGCGIGVILLNCLIDSKVKHIVGVDLSSSAIQLANEVIKENQIDHLATFINGGVEVLKDFETFSFDGIILFNIIDNLVPQDALTVIQEMKRICVPGGKLIVKFNPYITEEKQKEFGFKELEDNFFLETSGLYLWNLNDQDLTHFLSTHFTIEKYEEVYYPEHDMTNRLFYLINNKI